MGKYFSHAQETKDKIAKSMLGNKNALGHRAGNQYTMKKKVK